MTLTREEIINQPQGRRLDRWVQEHIFKWIPWAEQRKDYVAIVYQKPGEREPYTRYQNWEKEKDRYSIIPYSEIDYLLHAVYGDNDWSSDISAAWEVAENLKETFHFSLVNDARYEGYHVSFESLDGKIYDCDTNMMPEGICKAALLAALNL